MDTDNCIDRFAVISKMFKYFVLGLTVAIVAQIVNPASTIEDLLILAFSASIMYSALELGK